MANVNLAAQGSPGTSAQTVGSSSPTFQQVRLPAAARPQHSTCHALDVLCCEPPGRCAPGAAFLCAPPAVLLCMDTKLLASGCLWLGPQAPAWLLRLASCRIPTSASAAAAGHRAVRPADVGHAERDSGSRLLDVGLCRHRLGRVVQAWAELLCGARHQHHPRWAPCAPARLVQLSALFARLRTLACMKLCAQATRRVQRGGQGGLADALHGCAGAFNGYITGALVTSTAASSASACGTACASNPGCNAWCACLAACAAAAIAARCPLTDVVISVSRNAGASWAAAAVQRRSAGCTVRSRGARTRGCVLAKPAAR